MRQIILDTETTGLTTEDNHRIIEIGCIEVINRKFTGTHLHYYLNPERDIDQGAQAVHGITLDFLANKPFFSAIAHELIEFLTGAELIIHNATFDVGFINHELQLLQQAWRPLAEYCRIVDTLAMARQLHVAQRNSLDALCKRYNVDNSQRQYHGALLDAHLLGRVYLAMTGGQATLFAETDAEANAAQEQSYRQLQRRVSARQLNIILATAEEEAAHQLYLHELAAKGKCLWQTLELEQ